MTQTTRTGYCVFIDTVCDGPGPSLRDEKDKPWVFATQNEAEREIADNMITRLQEFIDGERDFDDALTVEEYVVQVDVLPSGDIALRSTPAN